MDFKQIVKLVEKETEKQKQVCLKNRINHYVHYFNDVKTENPDISIDELIEQTKEDIENFIKNNNSSSIKTGTIEYFLNKRMYSSSKYNVNNAYNEIVKKVQNKEINLDDYSQNTLEYTYNFNENTKILVCAILSNIKKEKKKAKEIISKYDELSDYRTTSKKELNRRIKEMTKGKPEEGKELKEILEFLNKDEREILQNEYKRYTEQSSENLKNECIKSIVENIKLINKLTDFKEYIKGSNDLYEEIYLNNYNYSNEESLEALSEKKLQKMKPEQLIAIASFWNNRASKVIEDINSTLYILSNKQLYTIKSDKENKLYIDIPDENINAIAIKINTLHKMSFELFDNFIEEKTNEADNANINDLEELENDVCNECQDEYREYFDKLLPDVDNSLKNDMMHARIFENLSYNTYKIKALNIQALLMSALNNENQFIENFGFIQDNDVDFKKKRVILLGFDVLGMNMPLRLHANKDIVLDVLNGVNGEEMKIPNYVGSKDFMFSNNTFMATKAYLPVSTEKQNKLKQCLKTVTPRDKYGNTIKHLNYIANGGKMPTHLLEEKEKNDNNEIDL